MRKFTKQCKLAAWALFILTACVFLSPANKVYAKKVKLNKKTVYMTKGSSYKLKITGTKKKAKWKSSNKKVVTVSKKGKLKARNYGTATITVKIKGKKLKCKVVVERKAQTRARKLRNYILSKGKYDKSVKGYVIKNNPEKEESYEDYVLHTSVTAWKGKYDLEFSYVMKPDSPESTTTTRMKINLISGTASVKVGSAYSNYLYMDEWNDDTLEGSIYTSFNGKGTGILLKKAVICEEDYDKYGNPDPKHNPVKDPAVLNSYRDIFNSRMNNAFKAWNNLFSKKKTLKKEKISMKNIGFSNWK